MKSNSNTTTQLNYISRDNHTDHGYEASPANNLYDENLTMTNAVHTITQSSIYPNMIHSDQDKKIQKTTEAKGAYFHESIDLSATIPSINNHMEEFSPCPPQNPKQNSKEGLAPQQNRNSAPIAHRKGQETRKKDAMTAPLAVHHTQDPQQNRMR